MSYWTYTDLFEEPGPPTAPFQGGFGLLNPQGIRKPAFFAYKYLHALQGDSLKTSDPQAMLATQGGNVTAVIWDFEQPEQKVSNRSFYTKLIPSHAAAPVQLQVTHLVPTCRLPLGSASHWVSRQRCLFRIHRDGLSQGTDRGADCALERAYARSAGDGQGVRSGPTGTVEFTVPMNSNDVVLVKLKRSQGGN